MQLNEKDLDEKQPRKKLTRVRVIDTPLKINPQEKNQTQEIPTTKSWLPHIDSTLEWTLYGLVFLMPLFFLPFTTEILELNKQALLFIGTGIITTLYLLRIVLSGSYSFRLSAIHGGILAMIAAYCVATFFSHYPYNSFIGLEKQEFISFATLAAFGILSVVIPNAFTQRHVQGAGISFFFSIALLSIIGILQYCGIFIYPWDFARSNTFYPVGQYDLWGAICAVALVIALVTIIRTSLYSEGKKLPVSFMLSLFSGLMLIVLLILDDAHIWIGVIGSLAVTLGFLYAKLP